jgi:hypothetical protein
MNNPEMSKTEKKCCCLLVCMYNKISSKLNEMAIFMAGMGILLLILIGAIIFFSMSSAHVEPPHAEPPLEEFLNALCLSVRHKNNQPVNSWIAK